MFVTMRGFRIKESKRPAGSVSGLNRRSQRGAGNGALNLARLFKTKPINSGFSYRGLAVKALNIYALHNA